MISCPMCHHQFLNSVRAYHAGINKQDCPSVRGLRTVGGQPMHQNQQHRFHHLANQSLVSATNHHVAFPTRFNRAINSGGGRVEAASPSTGGHHHTSSSSTSSSYVLKMRNRDADSAPVANHLTSATSHLSSKDKFSKYSALPAIQTTKRPPLLRQRTYDVLEPVYVKGPLKGKDTIKLPEIRQVTSNSSKKTTEAKKRTSVASAGTSATKTTLHHQSPEKKKSTGTTGPASESTKRQTTNTNRPTRARPQGFRPEQLSKDILPESPTAFWFPI